MRRLERIEAAISKECVDRAAGDVAMRDNVMDAVEAMPPPAPGAPGASAYAQAVQLGYSGTLVQWVASLKGADGKSAYELAVAAGFTGTLTQWFAVLKGDKGDKGDRGDAGASTGATLLGTVTIGETVLAIVLAGVRRVTVGVPSGWGVVAGQNLILQPISAPATGYGTADVVAGANSINVGVITPALAIGASYSIPCRLLRLNS